MRSERAEFPGTPLAGRLDLPDAEPRAFTLFAHCFTYGKDVLVASRISRALTDHGIAVLRFDFSGLGGSAGDFATPSAPPTSATWCTRPGTSATTARRRRS